MIRKALPDDASRVAEILIFTKRVAYRDIFRNDKVSFDVMRVLPLAQQFQTDPSALAGVYVFDDEFVKGVMHLSGAEQTGGMEIKELYVEPVFQCEGIGGAMIDFAVQECRQANAGELYLWVLEKNPRAMRFYESKGFSWEGERAMEEGTTEYRRKYRRVCP